MVGKARPLEKARKATNAKSAAIRRSKVFLPCHKSMEEKISGVGSDRVNLVLFIKPSTVINIRDP